MTGKITDKATGQPLPFANIFYSGKDGKITLANWGTQSDANGNYNLEAGGGFYVTAMVMGYKPLTKTVIESYLPSVIVNFALEPTEYSLPIVEIKPDNTTPATTRKMWPFYVITLLGVLSLIAINIPYEKN